MSEVTYEITLWAAGPVHEGDPNASELVGDAGLEIHDHENGVAVTCFNAAGENRSSVRFVVTEASIRQFAHMILAATQESAP